MKPFHQRTGISTKKPVIERIEGIHPYKMINYLLISVTCVLYAVICFFFIKYLAFTLDGKYDFYLPKFFTAGVLILLISIHFTSRILFAYKRDKISYLRKQLSYTLITGLLFFIVQSISWMELLIYETNFKDNHITTYVFTFSAIHMTFILTGMIMSGLLFYRYMLVENDPVKTLIMTTNPLEKVKLEVYTVFWHFNVLSWTMIFLMFLFAF